MSLANYWAYYTGAPALRTVARKKIREQLKNVTPPRGKKKTAEAVLLGRLYPKLEWPADVEELLNSLTEKQAKEAVKNIPLREPSGCSWTQLWAAYKERYR